MPNQDHDAIESGHGDDVSDDSSDQAWSLYSRRLGRNLAARRQVAGVSQEKLAHRAGISTFTYRKLENGESNPGTPANPRLRTLVMIARALEIPLAELLPEESPDLFS